MTELTDTSTAPKDDKSLKSLLTSQLDERKRWLIAAVAFVGAWFYLSDLKLLPGVICLALAYLFLPAHAQRFLREHARSLSTQIAAKSEALLAEYRDQRPTEPLARDWSEDDTLTEADAWPVAQTTAAPALTPVQDWDKVWPVCLESDRSNNPDSPSPQA